jgi:hypothetical protein
MTSHGTPDGWRGWITCIWVFEEYDEDSGWEEEPVRRFRLGQRTILTGTVIALGVAALTGLAASRIVAAPSVLRFSGHNVKGLPLFRVAAPSTMFWTNSGPVFQISSHDDYCDDGAVASQAHRGTTYLPAGLYRLRVRALGHWSIKILTGVEEAGTPIRFKGSGGRALPPFRLGTSKTMYWTNTGTRFQTRGPLNGIVSSPDHRGRRRLPAGQYQLYVDSSAPEAPTGSWTITIR